MSSFLYKKIWHGISIHTRKCIPTVIDCLPRTAYDADVQIESKVKLFKKQKHLQPLIHKSYRC